MNLQLQTTVLPANAIKILIDELVPLFLFNRGVEHASLLSKLLIFTSFYGELEPQRLVFFVEKLSELVFSGTHVK